MEAEPRDLRSLRAHLFMRGYRAGKHATHSVSSVTGYDGSMQLTVYSASWCRDCREAKRFLDKHSIPYTEIDIESTPGAADEVVRNVGKRAIPQFVIDGKWVQPYRAGEGFLYEEMSELLGVGDASQQSPR